MEKTLTQKTPAKGEAKRNSSFDKTRDGEKSRANGNIQLYTPSHASNPTNNGFSSNQIFHLQRTIGNRAVGRLIQAKLTVGRPDDEYEREADRVADTVMRMTAPGLPEDEENTVQTKPAFPTITPLVQRAQEDEEEPMQMKPAIQRQAEEVEEEEPLQTKLAIQRQPEEAEEEELQTKPVVQRDHMEDEEEQVQTKPADIQCLCPECEKEAQRPPEEDEEATVQTKPAEIQRLCPECEKKMQRQMEPEEEKSVQTNLFNPSIQLKRQVWPIQPKSANGHSAPASQSVEANISAMKGGGGTLPAPTRDFFESRFGADFSQVRIHTDSRAAETSKSINARAFTVGSDIAFGTGQYTPETSSGKSLLAHELTHVVQQESGVRRADTPVQRSATSEVLQRQPTPQQAKPEIKFRFGWLVDAPVETNEQVAALARLAIASLQDDLGDVESASVKAEVTEWIATVTGALPYFDRHAGEKVDPSLIPLINHQYDELLQVRAAVHKDKLIQIKEALWREHDAAVKAAEQAEALQPALDDALRAAYRKGSNSTVKEAVSTVKGALSVGRNLRSLAADITKDIMGLPIPSGTKIYVDHWTSQIGRPKITIINVGKYTETLGKLGRGLSALNVALTIADRSKKATQAEQGMKDLSDAVSIGTDLISASPLAAPPHFSLYSTLYLKPMLKVIGQQIGVLVENLSDINRTAVEATGDLMYPNAEPGGQEMFDLMVKVMHAGDESGFPALPSGVKEYLFDHREKLGTGAESDVPTEGSWFWKDLDGPAARRWLFANRKRVWAMFYGSMKVPAGKH